MSAKAISEASGKTILNKHLGAVAAPCLLASVNESTSFSELISRNSWLKTTVSGSGDCLETVCV